MKRIIVLLLTGIILSCQNKKSNLQTSLDLNSGSKKSFGSGSENTAKSQKLRDQIINHVSVFVDNNDFDGYLLVQQKGQNVVSESFSSEEVGFTQKTPFMVGSITKTFTAEIISVLALKGMLNLSTNYIEYVPGIPISDEITIDHLLSHSAGVPDYFNIPEFKKLRKKDMPLDKFAKWISEYPLDFKPGQGNNYSNSGYNLLAFLIESVTKRSFSDNLKNEIFGPLNMLGSGSKDVPIELPQGFEPGNSPDYLRLPNKINATWLTGSGSVYATSEDLLKWCNMIKKRLGDRLNNRGNWKPYGWGVRQRGSELYLEQNGRIPGYASSIHVYSESDIVIIVLSRIESDAVSTLASGISNILNDEDPETPVRRELISVPLTELSRYEGVYEITPSFFVTVRIDDGGLGIATGTEPNLDFAVLDPIAEDEFFFRVGYTMVKFDKNQNGEITGLYWGNSGPYPIVSK